jgi:diguanylate cyclase (GGDEF)-like protein
MPLDQNARQYADSLFTDKQEESSKAYQRTVVATTNQFAARGQVASGNYYAELVRLGIENVRELANARADTLLAAYERAKFRLDAQDADAITLEAVEYCAVQGGYLARHIQEKVSHAGMGNVGPSLAATITNEIAGIQAQIRRKLSRTLFEVSQNVRSASAQHAPPEQLDDLLPILAKRQFGSDFASLAAAADASNPLSMLMIDFDHFKSVNDAFGHSVGDEVLTGTAAAIKSTCKGKGHCYRWGGDELAVLLPNHTLPEARAVAERMREVVAEVKFPNYPNRVTLSIGIASYPGSCDSSDLLFNEADDAAMAAKKAGRDQLCVAGDATVRGSVRAGLRLSPTEIGRRLDAVRLWVKLESGRGDNFLLGVENKSDEEIIVEEIKLESDGYNITEPALCPTPECWKIIPRCSLPIGWRCQTDPAVTLIRLHDNEGLYFKTDLRVVLVCRLLGQTREFEQKIPIRVKVAVKEIVSLL